MSGQLSGWSGQREGSRPAELPSRPAAATAGDRVGGEVLPLLSFSGMGSEKLPKNCQAAKDF